ncbi:MAG: nuclease-related domain-containing protein [Immundisolibacter sp.]|uniref:nuclease-related domain-containing protein n=1 Tax=Immundisolibacter sp. TaxID=1934948 RepID=UPI003D141ED1
MTDFPHPDDRHEEFRLPGVPELRLPDDSWERRLDDWREMMLVRPHPELLAGARGELSLRRVMGRHETSRFGHIFGGKRVARDTENPAAGRYEIDLTVVTPRQITIVEVKHWSGTLRLEGEQWVYQRRTGEVQGFESLVVHNQNKVKALRRHLAACGLALPDARFAQMVVFTHPRIDLDERLSAHPHVVTLYELQTSGSRLGRGVSGSEFLLAKLIERCAAPSTAGKLTEGLFEMMTPDTTVRIAEAVGRLRTWDVVRLHGGRELIGDLLWLRIGGRRIDALPAGRMAKLHWWRGKLWGLVPLAGLAPFGRLRGNLLPTASIGVDDCIYFHEAGRSRPSVIALPHVDELRTG